MGQGGAAVLEKLVPQANTAGAAVEQRPAGEDQRAEQLLPISRRSLTAAHHRREAVKPYRLQKFT